MIVKTITITRTPDKMYIWKYSYYDLQYRLHTVTSENEYEEIDEALTKISASINGKLARFSQE